MNYILKNSKTIITAIVITAIFSGIIRIFSYKVGYYLLLTTVISYFIFRTIYFISTITKTKHINKIDKQHLAIFIALIVIVIFNNFSLLNAPFLSLVFLLIDYLISLQTSRE